MPSRLKQIPESLLATPWKERASREESLRAGNGRRFRVIYPGRIGTTAGPDFRDAVLEEEGVGLVRGDVEVHVRQRDRNAHGHDNDPRYNGVVLHLVARMDEAYSTLHSGGRVPVLSLSPFFMASHRQRQSNTCGPCSSPTDISHPETSPKWVLCWTLPGIAGSWGKAPLSWASSRRRALSRYCTQPLWRPWVIARTEGLFWNWPTRCPTTS